MSLLTHRDDVPDDVTRVRHARCGRTFSVDDVENDGADKLLCQACEDESAGTGYGFIGLRRLSATERAGGMPYGPLPWWFARGERIALNPLEFRLIMALWGFQGQHDEARPTVATLAALCGRGERHVGRVLDSLTERGLLHRWRPSLRQAYRYDVGPLIRGEVDADTAASPDTHVRTESGATPDTHVRTRDADEGAAGATNDAQELRDRTSTSTQTGHPCTDSVRTPTSGEEEVGEEEPEEEEPTVVGSGAAPDIDDDAELSPEAQAYADEWAYRQAVRRGLSIEGSS